MFYRWFLNLKQPHNRLWLSTILSTLFAIGFAFAAKLSTVFLPADILPNIELDTLNSLLDVIASTMFAVSTFSLSIMVSAFSSAANSVTPRATTLVVDDKASRRTISSFISAFIYAIIAKTALGLDFFGQNGQFVLFVSTILVLIYVIFTLIQWIYVLSKLGRLGNTLDKIYFATENTLKIYRQDPQMGACWQGVVGMQAQSIQANSVGYLTHIHMEKLQEIAEKLQTYIHIEVRPGQLILPDTILAKVDVSNEIDAITRCFVIDKDRSFDQDPEWGFIVLSEVAQRALSPAVNDPGTAINVMATMMKLLIMPTPKKQKDKKFDRLSIISFDLSGVIKDGFSPIARDGGAILEVQLILQKSLAAIWRNAPEKELASIAKLQADEYLKRAKSTLMFEQDKETLIKKSAMWFSQ
ncbi:DUF2254 domain-containing protein [Mannheimia sp. AT1]|uniref:DUF2254 domain-containing protein n=1 Tax=Mannheimia cairinae TaxID=3025936 RepID=A0ABT5MMC6_9PAST|nr:DUF2254 family protein [Mannheimia cairinae]MDD0823336.1 DUF2254 domain-containing protein [Mannheimia cairinae]MDD0827056.1 DUF2254 domain-containing protein [Mannheimia cairinae]